MSLKGQLINLPANYQFAFMTECLMRAVNICRPSLNAAAASCLDRIVDMAWNHHLGREVSLEEKAQLHVHIDKIGNKNSPRCGGKLEVFHCANAATFVLAVIGKPSNISFADTSLYVVPSILRAMWPTAYQIPEEEEIAWQERTLKRLQTAEGILFHAWFE